MLSHLICVYTGHFSGHCAQIAYKNQFLEGRIWAYGLRRSSLVGKHGEQSSYYLVGHRAEKGVAGTQLVFPSAHSVVLPTSRVGLLLVIVGKPSQTHLDTPGFVPFDSAAKLIRELLL